MADQLLEALRAGCTLFDLGRPLFVGMPQSPNHPRFFHTLVRRHGDVIRPDGTSPANDALFLGCHVGTHVDAVAHVSHDGLLHGGVDASQEQTGGRLMTGGIHRCEPVVCRGVLVDVPAVLGLEACPPAYEITPADLEAAVARQGTVPEPGDALLVRSGWGRRWDDSPAYVGTESGVPGVGEAGAVRLADWRPRVVGADTIAFERVPPGLLDPPLPGHRVLLVEAGINIIEAMDLEGLAAAEVFEFTFVLAPLAVIGATGAPARPLALVASP